ncbi:hypothetical protein [uncultured Cardiobacterium sp.]|nr:hypothetical protein [uncultured Cardiobacterium sp.]
MVIATPCPPRRYNSTISTTRGSNMNSQFWHGMAFSADTIIPVLAIIVMG